MNNIISWEEVQTRKERKRAELMEQLSILKEAGVIREVVVGGETFYEMADEKVEEAVARYMSL